MIDKEPLPGNDRAADALKEVLGFLRPDDGERMAEELVEQFGSPGALIEAGKLQMMHSGLSESEALLLSIIPDIVRHMERFFHGDHPHLTTVTEAERYLKTRFIGCGVERYYLLTLEKTGRLIECVHLQTGQEDRVFFSLAETLKVAIDRDAAALVMAHNHPNGTPEASSDDRHTTERLIEALQAVDIPLLDHIIMAGKTAVSMRGWGFLERHRWLEQNPNNELLQHWLDDWCSARESEEIRRQMNMNRRIIAEEQQSIVDSLKYMSSDDDLDFW